MKNVDLVIIGAGAAGLASAYGAKQAGVKDILIIERSSEYGGILEQCIHNGFGLHTFDEELSGPAYAQRYYELIKDSKEINIIYDSAVLEINKDLIISYQNKDGYHKVKAKAIILATGSRERSACAIGLRGDRPQGIYTAGSSQQYLNKEGYLVGKRVFILGSGDIGLIMARRMTLEGAKVIGVAEIMPYSNGLARNIKQCLEDFDIPLYLSHTVKRVYGKKRLEAIDLVKVDEKLNIIEGTSQKIEVDALLLSVGLIPENDLIEELGIEFDKKTKSAIVDSNYMTKQEGIFICGNALHIHDLVDYVSLESERCGKAVARYLNGENNNKEFDHSIAGNGISYIVPQLFDRNNDIEFMFRSNKVFKKVKVHIYGEGFEKYVSVLSLAPSEMMKIKLSKDELQKVNGDLHLEVCE